MMRRGHSRPRLRAVPDDEPCRNSRDRYANLPDRRLAAILAAEDTAEEHGLDPHVRSTCYVHRCWIHQCISDPLHALVVTGHRWCRSCDCPADVLVDEEARTVQLYCPACGREPVSAANRQVLYACRTSLAAMHGGDSPTLYAVPDL
ncbi:MAG TPA: hypothetical protein VJX66_22690 [Amycolatopsis sp.]|nr:hypothetical protein [Amycolatopsis sp.]